MRQIAAIVWRQDSLYKLCVCVGNSNMSRRVESVKSVANESEILEKLY